MHEVRSIRPRIIRSARKRSSMSRVDNVSLLLIGSLLIVLGMMLRG